MKVTLCLLRVTFLQLSAICSLVSGLNCFCDVRPGFPADFDCFASQTCIVADNDGICFSTHILLGDGIEVVESGCIQKSINPTWPERCAGLLSTSANAQIFRCCSSDRCNSVWHHQDFAEASAKATSTPEESTPTPGASTPTPGVSNPTPGPSTLTYGMSNPTPGTSNSTPGTSTPTPGPSTLTSGVSNPTPGVSTPTPGTSTLPVESTIVISTTSNALGTGSVPVSDRLNTDSSLPTRHDSSTVTPSVAARTVNSSVTPLTPSSPPPTQPGLPGRNDQSLEEPEPYTAWITAVVVSISVLLVVVTLMIVVAIVVHYTHCLSASASTTPEESSSGSDFKPNTLQKTKLMKEAPQMVTKIQVVATTEWNSGKDVV